MEAPPPPSSGRRYVNVFAIVFGLVGLIALAYVAIVKGETPPGGRCTFDFECADSHRGPSECSWEECSITCVPACDPGEGCSNGACFRFEGDTF